MNFLRRLVNLGLPQLATRCPLVVLFHGGWVVLIMLSFRSEPVLCFYLRCVGLGQCVWCGAVRGTWVVRAVQCVRPNHRASVNAVRHTVTRLLLAVWDASPNGDLLPL
jgi:hypothetical protein